MSAGPVAMLGVGAAGVATTVAGVLAQAADSGSEIGPWISGGGTATLVTLLAYLFKQFLAGNIISRPIAERDREYQTMLAAMAEREDKVQTLAIASVKREQALTKKIEDANRVLWKATEALEGRKR